MTPRKKLIEVALPLKAINEASAREKEPFTRDHPRSLHVWWARRPLVACRAVLFASLVDDPESDPSYSNSNGTVDEERAGIKRAELFNLIEELVQWQNSNNPRVIDRARAEIARCMASRKIELGELKKDTIIFGQNKGKAHPKGALSGEGITAWEVLLMIARPAVVNYFLGEYAPPVLDPFCVGGSIPLEAQRLGLRAHGSDLNPVAVLITKALIEIPPKFVGKPPVNRDWQTITQAQKAARVWQGAQGLAEDVRYYGKGLCDEAAKRIGHLYPKVKITAEMASERPDLEEYIGEELTVSAWLWARTVASPNPACHGAHVPLVRTFSLSTRKGKESFAQPVVDQAKNTYRFLVRTGSPPADFDPKKGTVVRTGATCLLTGSPISFEYIREEGKAGRMSVRMLAIVAGERGRIYLSPTNEHAEIAACAEPCNYPESDLPQEALGFRVQLYGLDKHYKLFTARQLVALTTFSDLVGEVRAKALADAQAAWPSSVEDTPITDGGSASVAYADAVATYLALAICRWSDLSNSLSSWNSTNQNIRALFARQAIPMAWDFVEVSPFGKIGTPASFFDSGPDVIANLPATQMPGIVKQLDATATVTATANLTISTDPPYYDNIAYADLSDFFYVWLRRSLSNVHRTLFATLLTPKAQELVASPFRHDGSREKAKRFFEAGLKEAFDRMRAAQSTDFPISIYYAFKQSENVDEDDDSEASVVPSASTGWETMLSALIQSGFTVSGTWPMRTERGTRTRSLGSNALASSVVLVCRLRPADASLSTRKQFMDTLRSELPGALKNLQNGNIAPVDLAQAAVGPGMGVFTRYAKVIESDGSAMTVRTALGLINQVLDEVLAEQEGDFDADTRWALAWFEQYGMKEGKFGDAETLSKAKDTAVNRLEKAGIVKAKHNRVCLIRREDLDDDWDPATNNRVTVWESTQHLVRRLQTNGESETADLLNKLGGLGETARELAYRLYSISERKKWADEALAYNSLVIAWPELSKLALSKRTREASVQGEMF